MLNKEQLEQLWGEYKFNRSQNQLNFLYELLEEDFKRLVNLLLKMKGKLVNYCPGNLKEIEELEKL